FTRRERAEVEADLVELEPERLDQRIGIRRLQAIGEIAHELLHLRREVRDGRGDFESEQRLRRLVRCGDQRLDLLLYFLRQNVQQVADAADDRLRDRLGLRADRVLHRLGDV